MRRALTSLGLDCLLKDTAVDRRQFAPELGTSPSQTLFAAGIGSTSFAVTVLRCESDRFLPPEPRSCKGVELVTGPHNRQKDPWRPVKSHNRHEVQGRMQSALRTTVARAH